MESEAELERLALRVAELAGTLNAQLAAGADLEVRLDTLAELRRQLEALESQATLVAIEMRRPPFDLG